MSSFYHSVFKHQKFLYLIWILDRYQVFLLTLKELLLKNTFRFFPFYLCTKHTTEHSEQSGAVLTIWSSADTLKVWAKGFWGWTAFQFEGREEDCKLNSFHLEPEEMFCSTFFNCFSPWLPGSFPLFSRLLREQQWGTLVVFLELLHFYLPPWSQIHPHLPIIT